MEYLGHVISAQGVHTSPKKVQAILNAPIPQNVTELCSFLGLVNYYGKLIHNITWLSAPLHILIKKKHHGGGHHNVSPVLRP